MPPASRAPTRLLERELLTSGYRLVAGMDEVGRGALAGPVSVGVCLVDGSTGRLPRGLRDSKLLAPAAREALCEPVRRWAVGSAVGHASPEEIDSIGIIAALRLAGNRALATLGRQGLLPDVVILDGVHDWLTPPADLFAGLDDGGFPAPPTVRTQVKGDLRCAVVAGASVLAKCERDALMVELASRHPQYGWASNKGYSAPDHLAALREHGPGELHRRSWRLPTAGELEDGALVAPAGEVLEGEAPERAPEAVQAPGVRIPAPAGAARAGGPGA